jgi:hypothetical protein
MSNTLVIRNGLNGLPDIDKIENSKQRLICFDDCMNEDQNVIEDYYTRGRNRNVSVIFLSQDYYSISKNIRQNTDYLVLLKLRGLRNINMIINEHNYIDNRDLLLKMYYDATREKFSCFIIDCKKSEYRKNLLGTYIISGAKEDEDVEVSNDNNVVCDGVEDVYQSINQYFQSISSNLSRLLYQKKEINFTLPTGQEVVLSLKSEDNAKEEGELVIDIDENIWYVVSDMAFEYDEYLIGNRRCLGAWDSEKKVVKRRDFDAVEG